MSRPIDDTHDPELKSWVESANRENADFPIQNLPFGVFRPAGTDEAPRVGVAIGDRILDLARSCEQDLLDGLPTALRDALRDASDAGVLNPLMALGVAASSLLRGRLSELLRSDAPRSVRDADLLVSLEDAELLKPVEIGDFTDFYASVFHATNVGKMFRPDNPLLPNYKHMPIGYHGRSSSVVGSGTAVRRPWGQRKSPDAEAPSFEPSQLLDYELEIGCLVGAGNDLGRAVSLDEAEDHVFGLCLLNDWSARDIQAWEYQPLGPFLAKSFATTVSPWVVTLEALAPFRCPAFDRPEGDPRPLPYLLSERNAREGGIDLRLQVLLRSERMRQDGAEPVLVSEGSFRDMYWTVAQMLTHHASNGCNLRTGDLLASGTVSGPGEGSKGCLLEITRRGAEPLVLPNGEERRFLADGDEVILRGHCEREGRARVGFGECRGVVLAAAEEWP